MKYKLLGLAVVLGASIFFTSSGLGYLDYDNKKNGMLLQILMGSLDQLHYDADELDNDFSKKVYNLYLKQLDRNKRFFIQSDVDQLSAYETKIDDAIENPNFDFLELSVELFEKRIAETEAFYEDVLAEPFDFSKDEYVEFDFDKLTYATSSEELKERWHKWLKYQTLTRLHDAIEEQEKALEKDPKAEKKSYNEQEAEARERVLKNHKDWFKRMNRLDERDRMSAYINAITNAQDPHTGYFPPKDKEDFDIQMSGKLEGIGARLIERDGYIKVTEIIAGSPSWKQGKLKAEDLILKVAQADGEPVDVVDMKIGDAVQLIRGKKGTEVRLTVKSVDGTTKVIPIIRDVVLLEEGYAKASRLSIDGEENSIGYIKLPRFYADFSNSGGRDCSDDVQAEIAKLKKEKVGGIILDLRNNGGGSLQDVVEMTGLFIDEGPIVQVKAKEGAPYIYEDEDPSIQYDGPLVVLVNSFSASASEIMSGALQDYGRAVIVGTGSTFGKGTVQRFIDLDRALSGSYDELKPLGSVKMTIQKFYRINGGTNQLKGVIPDVILPDAYSYIEVGEQEQEHAMTWDEIKPLDYNKWDGISKFNEIVRNSKLRTKANESFQLIEENARRMKKRSDKTSFTLCLDKYRKEQETNEKESKTYEDTLEKEIDKLQVHTLLDDKASIESDTTKAQINDDWHKSLKKDNYVFEAINIVKDLQRASNAYSNNDKK